MRLDTSWVTESFAQGTEFSLDAYKSMRDDGARTPKFVEAINRRLKGHEGEFCVVDVGTGPFALLAIAAAKAGARQVCDAPESHPLTHFSYSWIVFSTNHSADAAALASRALHLLFLEGIRNRGRPEGRSIGTGGDSRFGTS